MIDLNIVDRRHGATLQVDGTDVVDLSPSEMLQLSDDLRAYVVENVERFPEQTHANIRVNGRSFAVVVDDHFPFWQKVHAEEWEPETFAIFDRFIDADTLFLDVGAWIGPTSLYAAQIAKRTVAFEPDPKAFKQLEANVAANERAPWQPTIEVKHLAVGTTDGSLRIGSRAAGGDSMSSALLADEGTSWVVPSVDFRRWLQEEVPRGQHVFCKMDIEGFEYELIPRLAPIFAAKNLTLYLSLHPIPLLESLAVGRRGIMAQLAVRSKLYRAHRKVIRALKDGRCEYVNGRPFRSRRELIKSLIYADFPHSLVVRFGR